MQLLCVEKKKDGWTGWGRGEITMRSPSNVSHLKSLLPRNKAGVKGARELESGAIESAACATFPLFDGAEKEAFWVVDPRLWWSPFIVFHIFTSSFFPLHRLIHILISFLRLFLWGPLSYSPSSPSPFHFKPNPSLLFYSFLPSHLHLHFCPPPHPSLSTSSAARILSPFLAVYTHLPGSYTRGLFFHGMQITLESVPVSDHAPGP